MIFAALLLISCGSDDDSGSEAYDPALVGTWEATEIVEELDMEFKESVTFRADKTGTATVTTTFEGETETESENFTWSTSGNRITIKVSGEPPVISTYSISGNKLTVTDDEGEVTVLTKV